jgi:hypothetical protein
MQQVGQAVANVDGLVVVHALALLHTHDSSFGKDFGIYTERAEKIKGREKDTKRER